MRSALQEILSPTDRSGGVALLAFDSHSGVVVRTPSSALIFDPLGIKVEEVNRADAIIITHEHSDHLNVLLVRELQRKTGAPVITTPFVTRLLSDVPREKLRPLKIGESIQGKGVRLQAFPSEHPGRQPLSFLLETVEGVRIYHPSDSDPFPEMSELAHGAGTDLVLYLGSSLEKALRIARLVQPRVLLSRYLNPAQTARQLEPMAHGTRGATLRPLEIYRYP